SELASDADAAFGEADNAVNRREPEARSLAEVLGREEWIEDALAVLGRDAFAVVDGTQLEVCARRQLAEQLGLGVEHHGARGEQEPSTVAANRLPGVARKVEDDLLEL